MDQITSTSKNTYFINIPKLKPFEYAIHILLIIIPNESKQQASKQKKKLISLLRD